MNEYDYLAQARDKMDDEQYDEVITLCDKALEINPDLPQAYGYRGKAKYELRRYEDAVDDYSKATDIDSENAKYLYDRSQAYYRMGEIETALLDINLAIYLDDENYLYYRAKGLLDLYLERYKEAVIDFASSIFYKPTVLTYIYKAECYAELELFDSAFENFKEALTLDNEAASAYYGRGMLNKRLERFDDALNDFEKVLELFPDDDDMMTEIGFIKIGFGDKSAMKYFDNAIKINPGAENYRKRVEARAKLFEKIDINKKLMRGIALDLSRVSEIYDEKQAKADIKDLNKAISYDAESAELYEMRAERYQYLKKYAKVLKDRKTLCELYPENYIYLLDVAYAEFDCKKYKSAIKDFNGYLETKSDPGDERIFFTRGFANFKLGNYGDAQNDFSLAQSFEKTARSFYFKGLSNLKTLHFIQAYKDLKSALELNPKIEAEFEEKIPDLMKFVLGFSLKSKNETKTVTGLCGIEKI